MSGPRQFIPATPALMKPWVLQALQAGPQERAVLLDAVDALARKSGFKVTDLTGLKRTLFQLSQDDLVKNIRKGWWGLTENVPIFEAITPKDLTWGSKSMRLLLEIGAGAQYVYLLQAAKEVEDAQAKGRSTWECKIGKSKNIRERILSNVKTTFFNRSPEVGLLIRCDDCQFVEHLLHRSLQMYGLKINESAGNEYYETNPDQVADIYLGWFTACERIRSQVGGNRER